ncbi:MAG: fibronectin type III domain-containing protein, partial [Nitrospirota bacterium]|nr:fibronectin type III domain-containing protein [Nitrospirota bacterium]
MRGWRFLLPFSVSLLVMLAALLVMYTSPQVSHAAHTTSGAWVEDPAINGCNHCHNVTITAGNSNGSNRVIASSPGNGSSYTGARRNNWTSTVSYMISKGCPSTTAATTYLNTCYCTTCSNPNPQGTSCLAVPDAPPSTPTNVTAASDGSGTTINLSWTASTDDVGVASYNIYRDANPTPVGNSASTSFSDTGLSPNTSYSYEIEAVDTIGQKSVPKSTPVAATTTVDTTPPSQPTGVSCTPDASGTRVTLTWTASMDDYA